MKDIMAQKFHQAKTLLSKTILTKLSNLVNVNKDFLVLSMYKIFAVVAIVLALLAYPAQSKAFGSIVPGKSLGKIAIGESREDVLTEMKARPTNNYDLKHGLVEDEWVVRLLDRKDNIPFSASLSVWYRQNKVVQIELANQSTNFVGARYSTPSFNALIARNGNLKKVCYSVGNYDEKGEAFAWADLLYYDDVRHGIAYGADLQDDLILTYRPERINVHVPGVPVIPFSGLTNVKLETSGNVNAYKTAADADRARVMSAKMAAHKVNNHKPATGRSRKRHVSPVSTTTKSQFPFTWGPYTIKVVNIANASSSYPQELRICNSVGKILWKTDANHDADLSLCSVTGSSIKELKIIPMIEGSGGMGSDYYFSRKGGLYLLFSYAFGDSDGISGFTNFDHALRPEVEVDHSIVDFDNFAHGQRQVFRCVYKWNGSQYINATETFPHDALAAASISKAAYLRHWQNNLKADYQTDDETEGADSADRVDAIGYWANAMAIEQGDTAKSWLLDHANPQLALHLLRIEKELQKQIPRQGKPLELSMGNGKNLDSSSSR